MTEDTTPTTIEFDKPPINEIVCGVRFESIEKWNASHFGLLWHKFKEEFPKTEDRTLIAPVPQEDFKDPEKLPLPRVWFIEESENRLIQVQKTRFLHNWRKRRPTDEYPSYRKIIEDFEVYLQHFKEFLDEENLGDLSPAHYDLTYIDHIPQGEGWQTLSDIGNIFPNFVLPVNDYFLQPHLGRLDWKTIFLVPDLGELQIVIQSAMRLTDRLPIIRLEFTAMGVAIDASSQTMRYWFDSAHEKIKQLFVGLINDDIQDRYWGRKK